MDYMESMVVHIGRSWPQSDETILAGLRPAQNHIPGLPEGWRDGDWLITAASPSVAQPLGRGECLSVGGLGTSDRPLLQAAAEQRLAWARAILAHGEGAVQRRSASGLPADLIEEVCRWMPPRAELAKRGAERAVSIGIIVASLATREPAPCVDSQNGMHSEPESELCEHPWSAAAANLQVRFGTATAQEVWEALEVESGHAGRAAAMLRAARLRPIGRCTTSDET